MFVFKAAVVGAGTMGGQIAQTIASAGIPVVLKDVEDDLVEAGLNEARKVTQNQVSKLVERGKLNEEAAGVQVAAVVDRIHGTTQYDGFGDVDFVIEAVPERMEIKQAVFSDLDAVTPGHAILASNTSSLSITESGGARSRPDRVCGFHYFYPAAVMRLVEVVEGDDTSSETLSSAVALAQTIRKMPITCAEVPGFVVNRILNSALSEVWRMQEEQGLSIEKIDAAVTESKTAPMGPFYLGDLLGLDTVLHVAEYLDASYPGRMYVHGGLKELVAAGKLGAKAGGEGFYSNGTAAVAGDSEPDPQELADRFNLKALVEGCLLVEEGVVSTKDVDLGMMAGAGLAPPPFARADATGLDEVVRKLETAAEDWGERYAPPLLLRRLANQGRTGLKAGQGFFPYKRPDAEGFDQGGTVTLETRGDIAIAWLDSPPTNAPPPADERAPAGRRERPAARVGARARRRHGARAGPRLRQPAGVLRRRRHQGLHAARREHGPRVHHGRACPAARHGAVGHRDDRGGQRDRVRRRLRDRDGLRRADRGAVGPLRPARDQPGHHAGARRHPAAAAAGRDEQGARDEPHGRPRLC